MEVAVVLADVCVAEELKDPVADCDAELKVTPYVLYFNADPNASLWTTYRCRTERLRSRFGICEVRPSA